VLSNISNARRAIVTRVIDYDFLSFFIGASLLLLARVPPRGGTRDLFIDLFISSSNDIIDTMRAIRARLSVKNVIWEKNVNGARARTIERHRCLFNVRAPTKLSPYFQLFTEQNAPEFMQRYIKSRELQPSDWRNVERNPCPARTHRHHRSRSIYFLFIIPFLSDLSIREQRFKKIGRLSRV